MCLLSLKLRPAPFPLPTPLTAGWYQFIFLTGEGHCESSLTSPGIRLNYLIKALTQSSQSEGTLTSRPPRLPKLTWNSKIILSTAWQWRATWRWQRHGWVRQRVHAGVKNTDIPSEEMTLTDTIVVMTWFWWSSLLSQTVKGLLLQLTHFLIVLVSILLRCRAEGVAKRKASQNLYVPQHSRGS